MKGKLYNVVTPSRPPDPDPTLLCDPNIPKPLHGIAPRLICGEVWWTNQRFDAYERAGFRCQACGAAKAEVKGERKRLEAHERYDYDYVKGQLTFKGIVALCPFCHSFIHSGRLSVLLHEGKITRRQYAAVYEHGEAILRRAGLFDKWASRHEHGCNVPWQDWRLVCFGKAYGPSSRCMEDWINGDWNKWKPTGKEKTIDEA